MSRILLSWLGLADWCEACWKMSADNRYTHGSIASQESRAWERTLESKRIDFKTPVSAIHVEHQGMSQPG